MGDDFRRLIRWLASLHVPLGRWAPFAASILFAGAGVSHSNFLRRLAYLGASGFVLLIAADIANSFIDRHAYPRHRAVVLTLPMLAFRVLVAAVLGGIYSVFLFLGLGPWVPFILWPVIFLICCFIAWRNVDLWYEQGAKFQEELEDAVLEQRQALRTEDARMTK